MCVCVCVYNPWFAVPSVIEFEQPSYNVGEGDGVAEICVIIRSPSDPTTLPSSYSATISISTVAGNAQGKTPIPVVIAMV